MKKRLNIAAVVFGGGVSTLGMDCIIHAIRQRLSDRVKITQCRPGDGHIIKEADVVLISMYWFENVIDYLRLIYTLKIDPRKKAPLLVIGGINATNTRVLKGYFNYCILGDGEVVIVEFIQAIIDGEDPKDLPGVVKDGEQDKPNMLLTNPKIPEIAYEEERKKKIARIEIARGCRFKCPFCQIAHIKPYREQSFKAIERLLRQTQTKSVGLFAPDRSGHSHYEEIEMLCHKLGKENTAQDARLDMLMKKDIVKNVKFGIEAFSSENRRRFRKLPTDEMLIRGFKHMFYGLKNPKGQHVKMATVYMIGDLPNEGKEDVYRFWKVLREIDEIAPKGFILFLCMNSFSPRPFTPMERDGINPYTVFNRWWNDRPKTRNMVIAQRGGMLRPSNRIIHTIVSRGDERLAPVLFYIATKGMKIYRTAGEGAGKAVEKLITRTGWNPEHIYGDFPEELPMPHAHYTIQPMPEGYKRPPLRKMKGNVTTEDQVAMDEGGTEEGHGPIGDDKGAMDEIVQKAPGGHG